MKDNPEETRKNLLESARKEFLAKGFMSASLRTISANANVTTGAMYRYFENKDALFCALVDDVIEVTRSYLEKAGIENHKKSLDPLGPEHHEEEMKMFRAYISYIFDHYDNFVLLTSCATGSTHENFMSELADLYTSKCSELINWMYEQKHIKKPIDNIIVHVISNSLIQVFFEIVIHKIPQKSAEELISTYLNFYYSGWIKILDDIKY